MDPLLYIAEIEYATPAYDQSVQLRNDVLRAPLGLEFTIEELSAEYDSHHIGCFDMQNEELLGILILKPLENGLVKMRQVAIREDQQSRGLGQLIVRESEKFAISKEYQKIELAARLNVVPFYEKLGYQSVGDVFEEVTIPHMKMEKVL